MDRSVILRITHLIENRLVMDRNVVLRITPAIDRNMVLELTSQGWSMTMISPKSSK